MTKYSSSYDQERTRKAEERRLAPQQCPSCGTAMNEHLNEWDKIRSHCGADKCRKAASRASLAQRKEQARTDARARILQYCETQLDQEQRNGVMAMCDALMSSGYEEGHEIAEQVIQIVEAKRCKHDRIEVLERNAAIWKQKAQASERQLNERITELEAELTLFNGLEATIHGIATRQQDLQPDPEAQLSTSQANNAPRDHERERTLAVHAQAGSDSYANEDNEPEDSDEEE